jgi:predicted permease
MPTARFLSRFRALFRRGRIEDDLSEELRFHLQREIEKNIAAGLTPEEARYTALRSFGGVDQIQEQCRDVRPFRFFEESLQDMRYALRVLRKSPGFTTVAVLTLALGIGANTAIFSLLHAVMLRSLPVRDPEHLFVFKWTAKATPEYQGYSQFEPCFDDGNRPVASGCSFSFPVFERMRSQTSLFSGVAAFAGPAQVALSGHGPASIVKGELVSGEFFQTLGVTAALGRTLEPGDDTPTAEPVAVLNYGYWQRVFGGAPSIVGKTIRLNSIPFTIVGVAEPQFTRLSPGKIHDLWLPLSVGGRLGIGWVRIPEDNVTNWWLQLVARSKPGVSLAQAQAAASILFRNEMLYGAKPLLKASEDASITLVPAQKGLTGVREWFSKPLYVLMLAVGMVLLVACANIAGLTLSRASTRHKEMAVRLALGAGRMRLVRQLLTENICLSLAGGMVGIWLALWGGRALGAFVSTGGFGGIHFDVEPDVRVLAFTLAITLLTGVLCGVAPALHGARVNLIPALKGTESASARVGRRRWGLGSKFTLCQVALSVVVVVGAGLLVRTLANLKGIDPGFNTERLLLFGIDPTLSGYKNPQIQSLYRNLEVRLSSLPGVISVAHSSHTFLSGSSWNDDIRVEGQSSDAPSVPINLLSVTPRFFETMEIPLLAGRTFTSADLELARSVAIVNRTFVRRYLGDRNPLGLHFGGTGPRDPQSEIVGVVGDTKYSVLREEIEPIAYVPLKGGGAHFEVRTAGNPSLLIPAVRNAVSDLANDVPLFDVRTQSDQIDQLLFNERLIAHLFSIFGLLGLGLSCIGLYGLLSYEVTGRTHEIGIRVALGARPGNLLSLVVSRGMLLVGTGIVIGTVAAVGLTRYLESLLYGVAPTDAATFVAVAVLFLGLALLASYLPARRATRVDPVVALRCE